MGDITEVTGMVISAMPVGEYDRRVVLLTKERGKISAFAKGARRPNSPLLGITRAFVFGKFQLYEGKTSYNIKQADISNYFENIMSDYDAVCYACYFAEIADYYGRENLDASSVINLLYVSLKALVNVNIPNKLVKCIYELRIIAINGESPNVFECAGCGAKENLDTFSYTHYGVYCSECKSKAGNGVYMNATLLYTLQYIIASPLKKLFTFTVNEEILIQLKSVTEQICFEVFDKNMKSLEILENY